MVDQAQGLRDLVEGKGRRAHVLAVASGKGGVGKTNTSVNLAIALAQEGQRVVLLDADLGLANVEVLLGINSLYNLQHVISGEKRLKEILVQGPGGIAVVPGSSGLSQLADLGPLARQRILDGFDEVQDGADFFLIDTMAGIGQNSSGFASAADEVLIVATPEPSSIVDAYAMVKTIVQIRPDIAIQLVVNMALNEAQANAVAAKLRRVVDHYLDRPLACAGFIPRDPHVANSVMQTSPFLLRYPQAPASQRIMALARNLCAQRSAMGNSGGRSKGGTPFLRRFAETLGLARTG